MPGRRNFARERAEHALKAPVLQRQYAALLQHHDQALIGQVEILRFLERFGVRRPNGRRLSWRMVNRWRNAEGCPILRGNRHSRARQPALSSTAHLTAWVLSRFANGELFRVVRTRGVDHGEASVHASERAA